MIFVIVIVVTNVAHGERKQDAIYTRRPSSSAFVLVLPSLARFDPVLNSDLYSVSSTESLLN